MTTPDKLDEMDARQLKYGNRRTGSTGNRYHVCLDKKRYSLEDRIEYHLYFASPHSTELLRESLNERRAKKQESVWPTIDPAPKREWIDLTDGRREIETPPHNRIRLRVWHTSNSNQ